MPLKKLGGSSRKVMKYSPFKELSMPQSLVLPRPFDAHVHFRQGEMMDTAVKAISEYFAEGLVMPNTDPPVSQPGDIKLYRASIMAAADNEHFHPLMTFKILPDTSPSDICLFRNAGAVAGKVYPKNMTTNSHDGVENYPALFEVFEAMQEKNLVLCLHGEHPGEDIDTLDRERKFLRILALIARSFPRLRIVMEHISCRQSVETVLALPENVAASITVHHLVLTNDDVYGQNHHFCRPVIKKRSDRKALVQAATSGCPKFFFGSDSAPHSREKKECPVSCAGVFAPGIVSLPRLAQLFDENNALKSLERFLGHNGRRFYQLPDDPKKLPSLALIKEKSAIASDMGGVVPLCAGQTLPWRLET
jgi:dihydroorotase